MGRMFLIIVIMTFYSCLIAERIGDRGGGGLILFCVLFCLMFTKIGGQKCQLCSEQERQQTKERLGQKTRTEQEAQERQQRERKARQEKYERQQEEQKKQQTRQECNSNLEWCYRILGLKVGIRDRATIERAYRKFAMHNHPDKCSNDPEAAERFKNATEAVENLRKAMMDG